ncbi:ATP-binding protein [Pollutibacter soli]|uniref:ATP-binding protein n=1 Tax=Pollutibacter soli TaxID=3034157 RepID=UPI0030133008
MVPGNQRTNCEPKQIMAGIGFQPTIEVITKRTSSAIQIIINDNGIGIPQENLSKIFQPSFTTKPTGDGTGLGLSLAYDIITKAHGGQLTVETVPDRGTSFINELPASS